MNKKYCWKPSKETIEKSNIFKMMQELGISNYEEFWQWSVSNKEQFWIKTVENLGIHFNKKHTNIVDTSKGTANAQWLYNAKYNIVDSCFQNNENAVAIVFQEENGKLQKITQKELLQLVNKICNSFLKLGLKPGDRVAVNLPMTVEAVAVYLAAIKAALPVVTIADSFTPNEIAVRLQITKPKIIVTQYSIKRNAKELPLYAKIIAADAPKAIVIKSNENDPKLREGDIFWDNFLDSNTTFNTVVQSPEDCITILFSSGTTGEPKAIPWTHVTPIKCASDGYYHHNIQQNDVVCWPTNLGWMMGPWLVFASLINKATIALYYGAPTGEDFGSFVEKAKVTMLGVIPSFVKYWKSTKCMEKFSWESIKCFSSTGEVSNPVEMEYLMKLANDKPVIEYCGGTEIGGGYVTSTVVQPNYPSTFSTQALGGAFVLLDENNIESNKGEVFLIPPILGLSNSLLNRNHFDVYYLGTPTYKDLLLRRHGDQLEKIENGYYKAHGRIDDAMNLGGIKVSSVQIEAVLNKLNFIKESAAVAVSPKEGGPSLLVVYYVANEKHKETANLFAEAKNAIQQQLNPLFKLTDLVQIEALPRTASNKIMRRKLRDLYQENN
jgi:acetyl-CoA synthetase